MTSLLVVIFLVVAATSSLAAPPADIAILDVYESLIGDSQEQTSYDDACVDFYSITCKKTNDGNLHSSNYNQHLARLYRSRVYDTLIDILNGEIKNEDDPIIKEKKLFQNCLKLGKEDNNVDSNDDTHEKVDHNEIDSKIDVESRKNEDYSTHFTTDYLFHGMLEEFGEKVIEENWQKLDQKLASLGFKYSFFEINVVKDPENPNQNIIRLSPPSMKEWNYKKLTDVVSDIFTEHQLEAFDYCNNDTSSEANESTDDSAKLDNDSAFWESDESKDEDSKMISAEDSNESNIVNPMCKKFSNSEREDLVTSIVDELNRGVMYLLNELLQGIFYASNKYIESKRMTIEEWNAVYELGSKKKSANIDWYQVFTSYFEKLEDHIKPSDYILIENMPYFVKMSKIFSRYGNEIIAHTLRSKFVAENIRYYKWDWADEMTRVNKPTFCLGQNQFYAASAEVLKQLTLKMKPYDKKIETLLYQIAGALHSNISNANISEIQKSYLLSNLKDFTKNPFRTNDDSTIASYYKDFEITGNYLVDINRYNRLMREVNLKKHRDTAISLHRSTPFSVLDTGNPRNRYIMNSALNAIIYKNTFLDNKAVAYGSLGVRSASFLFSLLTETTFINDLHYSQGVSAIIPRVSYDPQKVSCFVKENVVKYGYPVNYNIITEVFSVRFAYEAMLSHVKDESTEEFFTAYTADHCNELNSQLLKKVLSNVVEFSTAFACSEIDNTVCKLQAF